MEISWPPKDESDYINTNKKNIVSDVIIQNKFKEERSKPIKPHNKMMSSDKLALQRMSKLENKIQKDNKLQKRDSALVEDK